MLMASMANEASYIQTTEHLVFLAELMCLLLNNEKHGWSGVLSRSLAFAWT